MTDAFQFIGGGVLLMVLMFAAPRASRSQRARAFDLGRVSDEWKAQLWLRRDDPAREP